MSRKKLHPKLKLPKARATIFNPNELLMPATFDVLGFKDVGTFPSTTYEDGTTDYIRYWARPDGLIAVTPAPYPTARFPDELIEVAKLYYNWSPVIRRWNDVYPRTTKMSYSEIVAYMTSTPGHYGFDGRHDIWVGTYPAQRGLRYHINMLMNAGEFLNPWAQAPGYIARSHLAQFPDWAREILSKIPDHV